MFSAVTSEYLRINVSHDGPDCFFPIVLHVSKAHLGLSTEWVSGEVIPVLSGPQGPYLQMTTETSSLTSEDDLQFTMSKTSILALLNRIAIRRAYAIPNFCVVRLRRHCTD